MESKLLNLNRDYEGGGGGGGGGGEGFIDRSKVRILLCDNDVKSSEEVFKLLLKCSYQVTSVKSARQVIDALNAEGPDIDIILSEVDLPMAKGFKMLKYITRDNDLRRIPVIMMSAKDEVSIVVKCLRLGAADYLVKPLRTNELLNLWTHMWRRRRMLGLVEKSLLNYDLDLLSDPSDANTNSTTLISDETDDKSHRNTNPDMGMSAHQDDEFAAAAAVESRVVNVLDCRPDFPVGDCQTGQFSPGPRKSELKIGQSSAFFTYVKSNTMKTKSQAVADIEVNDAAQDLRADAEHQECGNHYDDVPVHENGEAWESNSLVNDLPSSNSAPDSLSMERSCTRASMEIQHETNYKEERLSEVHGHPRNEPHHDVSGLPAQAAYPYCMPGVMNQIMMSSTQVYQKSIHDIQTHGTTPMMPHYNHLPQCPPHVTGMASYPYYPVSICLQSGQMQSTNQSWPSFGSSTSTEVKPNKVDRREAALLKFRQKRKERCFDKKIRYVNRKKLAERRPRVRGQFVRKLNGVNVDLNGQPSADYDEDEEVEEELESRDSSAEGGGSGLI